MTEAPPTSPLPAPGRLRPRDWLAVGAVDSAAHSMNSLGPFVVGGLIEELHFSATRMGVWSMTEMLAYAVSMFILAPRAGRLSLPALAFGAALLAAAGQILSAVLDSYVLLVLLRVATGTGFGLLNTAVNVFAARSPNPDKAISFAMAIQTALFAAMGFVLPKAGEIGGRPGMFLALGAFVLALIPFMLLQPSGAPERKPAPEAQNRRPWPKLRHVAPMLAATALFTLGSLAIWPFTERIGLAAGIDRAGFGFLTSVSNVLGFAACVGGGLLGARFGRTVPTLVFLLASGVACFVQAAPPDAQAFAIAFVANYALWFLAYPALIGAACALDPVGRLPTLCTASWLLSQAAGSVLAGAAGDAGNYAAIGWFGLICCASAAAVFLCVSIPLDRAASALRSGS
ncbi:putative MFS family arabinose efflux permease [Rhodoblastus acidophilus]|uniref:MFS transporter n=1 Tax=Rhodoblastus acidophilus TaxID=1074 RepID=UPI0022248148|nr:putative MFS family arabinose efflux permease [Rhodoblastus acidophilus]